MSKNEVTVVMSAQDAEQVASWQRIRREGPQAMEQEMKRLGRAGQGAGKDVKDAFGMSLPTIGQVATALTGVGSVLNIITTAAQLFRSELDRIKQRQDEIAGKQVSINGPWKSAAMQLAGQKTSITPDILRARIIANANGVDVNSLFDTFRESMAAAGNLSPESVLGTVEESARLAPQWSQQERSAMVAGSLELQKSFGASPKEALAGAMQTAVADRTVDPHALGTTIIPAISQVRALGNDKDSFEFIASKLIAFGQRAGDPHGRRTSTNFINLVRQLKEETVGAGLVKPDASIEESFAALESSPALQQKMLGVFAQGELGQNPAAILRHMSERRKVGGEFSTEARTFVAAMETLQPNTPGNRTTQEAAAAKRKLLGLTPAAVKAIEDQNAAVVDSPMSITANMERQRRQVATQSELNDISKGIRGQADRALEEASKIAGPADALPGRMMRNVIRPVIGAVQSDEQYVRTNAAEIGRIASGVGDPERREELLQLQRILMQQLEEIKALRQQLSKPQKVEVEKINDPGRGPNRSPARQLND